MSDWNTYGTISVTYGDKPKEEPKDDIKPEGAPLPQMVSTGAIIKGHEEDKDRDVRRGDREERNEALKWRKKRNRVE